MKLGLVVPYFGLLVAIGHAIQVETSPKEAKCGQRSCSFGWVPKNPNATGTTDEVCCLKTCRLHKCVGLYKANASYFGNVGNSDARCCEFDASATTTTTTMQCSEDGTSCPANTIRNSYYGRADTIFDCCDKTCSLHVCAGKSKVVKASMLSTRGNTDAVCCEPEVCANLRQTKTQLMDQGKLKGACSSVTNEWECGRYYQVGSITNNGVASKAMLFCEWKDQKCKLSKNIEMGCEVTS
eukprot:TRINITY_DN102403_c0_g1_i1.p1 TRINITY_DN102403_c0_g1~~TRINITY_DN102403_c0_g1_i1.p1  ORF type:complete len:239 (-),score=22.47 TRINITY_DN102403_c0_g1_i1:97-813(-)